MKYLSDGIWFQLIYTDWFSFFSPFCCQKVKPDASALASYLSTVKHNKYCILCANVESGPQTPKYRPEKHKSDFRFLN